MYPELSTEPMRAPGPSVNRGSVGQGKRKSGADSRPAFDADVALHDIDILLDDVEPETEAVEVAGMRLLELMKFLEDFVEVLLLNPATGIGHGKFKAFLVF